MVSLQEACDYLDQAIAEYGAARSMSAVETAMLAMHTGLEAAFRASLEGNDRLSSDTREALEKPGGVKFPELVDLMGDYTDVLGTDSGTRALLVSLNTTRARIAHPLDKPPPERIVNDARRLTELIIGLWPRLCADRPVPSMAPITMEMVHGGTARTDVRAPPSPTPPPIASEVEEKRRRARARSGLLQSLWRGEIRPSRWLLRLLGGLVVAVLASLAWRSAVALARWPLPVKTIGIALATVALGLAVWSGWLLWRVFRLLGVRRILILLSILYLSVVGLRVLTAEGEQPLSKRILPQVRRVASEAWGALAGFTRSLIEAPATFRSAYTGRNPLISVPGAEVDSTPLEGEIIEPLIYTTLDELTPTAIPATTRTPAPSRPEVSGGIEIGSYVQVSGTGGKTLRARSGPGTSYDIVTSFGEGTQLLVLEGPVEAEGYTWWKVRGDQDVGWCADRWLAPIE